MPPKTKRQRSSVTNLGKARAAKQMHLQSEHEGESGGDQDRLEEEARTEPEGLTDLLNVSYDVLDTDDEAVDPSFDLDTSITADEAHMIDSFCENWVTQMRFEDRTSLGLFLYFQLVSVLGKSKTEAAELAGMMVGKSEQTIRQWKGSFLANNGSVSESNQGGYQRSGVIWKSEELNEKATRYIRQNAAVKGKPNLTVGSFCRWVNEELLPNETLEPGFPRAIGCETARKWMHEMGFEVLTSKKGSFVDGHERVDVVEYRKRFLRRMVSLGFLNSTNAPTEQARLALPDDLDCPPQSVVDKTVVFFHDETTFQCNDDQPTFWGTQGTHIMKPKSKGAGIMVSDFIDEFNGYLSLTEEEYERAKESDPNIRMHAREFLEYGESKEGYWTSDKFMSQMKMAVKIAEVKYPKEDGWRHVWIFDHSSCHGANAEDSLDVSKMNVNPGGKQRVMRDGWWGGKPQRMTFANGVPKGLRAVLEERGVNTHGMNADQMREVLGSHPDFKFEKSRIERFLLEEKKHIVYLLPKFHLELNPIERVWAQAKRYAKAYCKYNIQSLRKTIVPALESVPLESIRKHFNKVRHYMFAYLEGIAGGSELEELVKKYKTEIQTHRRISEIQ